MRPELVEALVRDCPALFPRRRVGPNDGPRPFNFRVHDGWEPIVRRLAEKLEPFAAATGIRAVHVRRTDGTLHLFMAGRENRRDHCFHMVGVRFDDLPPLVAAAIKVAQDESTRTCEHCGAAGTLRGKWHVQTLCSQCADRVADRERGRRRTLFDRPPARTDEERSEFFDQWAATPIEVLKQDLAEALRRDLPGITDREIALELELVEAQIGW